MINPSVDLVVIRPDFNAEEKTIKLGSLTIRGRSTGGCETCIVVNELSLAFDMGYNVDKIESIKNVCISHGHIDHIGCLQYAHATRMLNNNMNRWQTIMPETYIAPYKVLATAVSSLARGGYPTLFEKCTFASDDNETETIKPFTKLLCEFVPAEECQRTELVDNPKYFIKAYKMKHKITSYGYIVYETRMKLKKEYVGMKGKEIQILRSTGVHIQDIIDIPLIAFTGDTCFSSVLENKDFMRADILIMECTHFNDSTVENAILHGHIHFQQFVDNIGKFDNKWIILCHFSQKYRKIDDIKDYLKVLSEEQQKRIVVWI